MGHKCGGGGNMYEDLSTFRCCCRPYQLVLSMLLSVEMVSGSCGSRGDINITRVCQNVTLRIHYRFCLLLAVYNFKHCLYCFNFAVFRTLCMESENLQL